MLEVFQQAISQIIQSMANISIIFCLIIIKLLQLVKHIPVWFLLYCYATIQTLYTITTVKENWRGKPELKTITTQETICMYLF